MKIAIRQSQKMSSRIHNSATNCTTRSKVLSEQYFNLEDFFAFESNLHIV